MNQTTQQIIPSVGYNNTEYIGYEVAKSIAKIFRGEGIRMRVVKGDGTTSPSGSHDARNYIEVGKDDYWNEPAEIAIRYNHDDGQRLWIAQNMAEFFFYDA